ncbi:TPA: winged helix-turn-helix domain-containing protein [Salmonella enterica subsp. enterica serovar Typhimurium]
MPNETVTVIEVLKEAGKATSQEIAARLDIGRADTLVMLRNEKDAGVVAFEDGGWSLANVNNVNISDCVDADVNIDATPTVAPANGMEKIIHLLSQNGEMTTTELAAEMERPGQALSSHLRKLEDNGIIMKGDVKKKKSSWRLLTQPRPQPQTDPVSSEEMVETIPAFTATATVMPTTTAAVTTATAQTQVRPPTVTPLPGNEEEGSQCGQYSQETFISRLMTLANQEKQYAIERIAKLGEVCEALSVLHKHQALIQQLELSGEERGGL